MARYIDAEPLEKEQYKGFDRASETEWQKGYWAGIDEMCEKIKAQPTADVVEVVHGEWITVTLSRDRKVILCSNCRGHLKTFGLTDYCPDCGAKMDGKKVE